MIKKIAYENKVAIQNDEEIARKNKVTDEDLNEIKEVVNNNADELENKISKQEGKGLSSNDFTNELKAKLNNLENYDDTEVKQDISNLDTNKASKAELQEVAIALQAELKATRKDLQAGTLEGQDTGESLYLQDSSDARFREFGITGNSKQEKREGYNKFDIQKWLDNDLNVAHGTENSKSKDKISLTATEADCFTNTYAMSQAISNNQQLINKFGTEVKPDTAYTIYLDKNNTETDTLYAFFCDADYNYISLKNKTSVNNYNILNFTTPENAKYLTFRLGIVNVDKTIEFSNIMILEGTYTKETLPKYEQYGAMPSLEFSSEIEAVGQDVNIFDKDSAVKGVMFTATGEVQNDKYFSSDYIKVKKNTDYYTNEYAPVVKAFDADKNQIGYLRNVATAGTFNTGNAEYIKARNSVQLETEEQMQNAMDNAKIVEGTEINGYSPYGCGSANVTVCNRNRFVPELIENVAQARANVTIEKDTFVFNCTGNDMYLGNVADKGTKYYNGCGKLTSVKGLNTISVKLTNELFKKNFLSCFDKNLISLGVKQFSSDILNNYTLPEGTEYVTLRFGIASPTAGTIYKTQVQIEEGDTTDYVAHEEQTFTVPVQQEMLEEDYFDLDNEEEVHTWGKYVFTGEESISKSGITNNNSFWMNSNFLPNLLNAEILNYTATDSITPNVLCTHLKTLKPVLIVSYDNEGITICANDNNLTDITIRFGFGKSSEINTADKCKAWLKQQYEAGTPVTVYYKLKTPTRLPFTEAQKTVAKQIRETLHSYKGGTHVYSVDEVSPTFNVKYTRDQEAYIKNQLKPIIQELTGGN